MMASKPHLLREGFGACSLSPQKILDSCTVGDLKKVIEQKSGIPSDEQRLTLAGKQLEDEKKLSHYKIKPHTMIHLIRRLRGGGREEALYLDPSLREPRLDYDFTHMNDGSTEYYRGSERYYRPCGWRRYALKVSGKFPGGDAWLGRAGSRTESSPGEWPVSYHGTAKSNADSIARGGFDLSKGRRFLHGRGIYSTPDISVAAKFAEEFQYDGKSYKMVFQNRVRDFKVVPKIGYWVSSNDRDIRPYGICIKETLYQVTTPRPGLVTRPALSYSVVSLGPAPVSIPSPGPVSLPSPGPVTSSDDDCVLL